MNAGNVELRDRVAMLVGQVLGTAAQLPHPFPVNQRLSDLGVSSLKMVNLMLAVEMEFNLEIPQAEITPDNFHCVASIQAMLARLRPLHSAIAGTPAAAASSPHLSCVTRAD